MIEFNYKNIPDDLKRLFAWVCWKAIPKENGKIDKIPIDSRTGKKASSADSKTWSDYETAVQAVDKFGCTGIGFMFGGTGFCGVDVDHCVDKTTGELTQLAHDVIEHLNSYTEISPSGTGIHIIVKAALPPGGRKNTKLGIEMYDTGRFFTITGNVLHECKEVSDRSEAVADLHAKYFNSKNLQKTSSWINQKPFTDKDNEKVLLRAKGSKNGYKFLDLYQGNWMVHFESQSEADISICNTLAWYTNGNPAQIDAIFRTSGLMRDKWDEVHGSETYGYMTIQKAIDFYNSNRFPHIDLKGIPLKHWENTLSILDQNDLIFRFNELTNEIECDADRLKNLSYEAIITEINGLCIENGYPISENLLDSHVRRIAELNRYSPVKDYLIGCKQKWDGKSRIEELYKTLVLDAECDQDEELSFLLFKKWLVTCALMAFNSGTTAAQGMWILKGKQGIGKTRWLSSITPNPKWVKDGLKLDPANKDDVMKVCRYWIVELGELKSTIKREKLDDLKNFITAPVDTYRAPYDRVTKEHPRMTVFFGTVNDDTFLKDLTGDRRYWVLSVERILVNQSLDISQLWGEVTYMALEEKYPHYLTQDEIDRLECNNEKYKVHTPEEQLLLDSFRWEADKDCWGYLSASELCELLGLPLNKNVAVGKALKALEYLGIHCPKNNRFKKYKCPPFRNFVLQSRVLDFFPDYKKDFNGLRIVGGR